MAKRPTRSSRPAKHRHATAVFAAGAACLLLLAGVYMWLLGSGAPPPRSAGIGGAFALTQDDGRVVTERDFRGRYMLVYFGYTHCADVCPTTLSAIADAMDILGGRAADLRPVFITVDPQRDPPDVTRAYASQFSPGITGLSGTPAQISSVERAFGIRDRIVPVKDHDGMDYVVDHTAALILVGPDGRYVAPFPAMEDGKALARQLAQYLPPRPAGGGGDAL
jgi:protein SCO1/2